VGKHEHKFDEPKLEPIRINAHARKHGYINRPDS